MKVYEPEQIRNIALLGHAGSGKTSLAEAILFETGATNRRGTVDEKNTASDYNEIEHERSSSVFSTPLFAEWNNVKFNIVDTPGYDDYIGEIIAAIRVAETGVICLNAQNGIEVGSENAWRYTEKYGKPVIFAINKMDVEQANFDKVIDEAKSIYGRQVTALQYPLNHGIGFNSIIDLMSMSMYEYPAGGGKGVKKEIPASEKDKVEAMRGELIDAIAETDEDLMTKYFENGTLEESDLKKGLKKALVDRAIFPVFCVCSKLNMGVDKLVDFIEKVCPNPTELVAESLADGRKIPYNAQGPASLFVYKVISEAHLGDMTFFKVMTGKLNVGADLINEQKSVAERFNQIFIMNGKKRIEVPTIVAGDIGATVKLKSTQISHTLHEKGYNIEFPKLEYPNPKVRVAVVPKTKGEEEKVGMGLHAIGLEDPSLRIEHSQELRQIIVFAQGENQLQVTRWRLEHRYKVEAEFIEPKVPYRETIQKQVRGSYRHKKQSGGAGQFAEVHMLIEPWHEGMPNPEGITVRGKDLMELDWGGKLEYVNCIVGGVIDQRFMPAILKGVMDKMQFGPLTGSYVRDIRIAVYDGKMHPVDSNEAAFKTAGMMVFKENFIKADPKILEPIYNVEIKVPEDFVGDVMSDLPTRRGVILGIESDGRYQIIKARMPLAELDKYSTGLRSMTQARATYSAEFAEYQSVPPLVQQKLMDDYKKQHEEEA